MSKSQVKPRDSQSALFPPQERTVREAIEARYSISLFQKTPVPDEEILDILHLTSLAPSGWNLQPWRFIIVKDASTRSLLSKAAYGQIQIASAPITIVLYSDMAQTLATLEEVIPPTMPPEKRASYQQDIQHNFELMSEQERGSWSMNQCHIALAYLTLAASTLGYDTSIVGGFDQSQAKAILNLSKHVFIAPLVALGKAAISGYPRHRLPLYRLVSHS